MVVELDGGLFINVVTWIGSKVRALDTGNEVLVVVIVFGDAIVVLSLGNLVVVVAVIVLPCFSFLSLRRRLLARNRRLSAADFKPRRVLKCRGRFVVVVVVVVVVVEVVAVKSL